MVQVEDGTKTKLTKSDLGAALEVLEKELGPLGPDEVAHSFQEGGTLLVGDSKRALHYVAPPDIEVDPDLPLLGRDDLRRDTVLMAVPPVLVVDFDHPARSQRERTRREDRRLKFYGLRDMLR